VVSGLEYFVVTGEVELYVIHGLVTKLYLRTFKFEVDNPEISLVW
jgi:hypothetical protein